MEEMGFVVGCGFFFFYYSKQKWIEVSEEKQGQLKRVV